MANCFVFLTMKGAKLPFINQEKFKNIIHIELGFDAIGIVSDTTWYEGSRSFKSESVAFPSGLEPLFNAHLFELFKNCEGTGLIVYQHDEQIFSFCKSAIAQSQLPYAIWIAHNNNFNWKQQHFVAAARYRFCLDENAQKSWHRKYVYQCEFIDPEKSGNLLFNNLAATANRSLLHLQKKTKRKAANRYRVLLVSYFMPPAQTVAVHRIEYWRQTLPKLAKTNNKTIDISVITACGSFENDEKYVFIPDTDDICIKNEATETLVQNLSKANVNYFASRWAAHVEDFFEKSDTYYDCVIISGNPFYYFSLGEYFKEKFKSKIILDFRDPFANNPRFIYTPQHKKLVLDLEKEYLTHADHVLSVNKYCLDAIGEDDKNNGVVVANGFDERIVDRVKPRRLKSKDKVINFVYTGSFYTDRKPDKFLKLLSPDDHRLIHIGRTSAADEHLDNYPCLQRYGLMPYEHVIGYCHNMSAGIIFTSGAAFEQTTKIFDYIACDIDIIIVTDGKIKTGELHNLTKDMPGVYWVQNKPKQIKEFLETYKPRKRRRKNRNYYSRLKQTEKLYELIVS